MQMMSQVKWTPISSKPKWDIFGQFSHILPSVTFKSTKCSITISDQLFEYPFLRPETMEVYDFIIPILNFGPV